MQSKEDEYREIFFAEALENFEEINKVLTQLEKKPEDQSLINVLFRITHTMKGNATAMGFDGISSLAHVMEDLFGEVRNNNLDLNSEIFTALFKAVDVLGALLNSIKTGDKVQYKGIKTKLEVLIKRSKKDNEESVPTDDPITESTIFIDESNDKAFDVESPDVASQSLIEEYLHMDAAEDEEVEEESVPTIVISDLVQVPVRKLDNLLNLVGELIIERDRIIALNGNEAGANEYSRLNRISSDLQYSVMDVRLVQVGFLFNKFHRVVRDAAALEGKKARLELKGVDTEIDRNILQIISDSLIHLIRNAVSHGIESPEERKELGKKEEGVVTLSARNDNDGVIIEIRDNGKGINVEQVKAKALKSGLVQKEMLPMLNKEEVLMLIFEPGFSTREQVTELSGRGVGMDVVKRATDSIGGTIRVETEDNEGSVIYLKLPSSMAVKGTLLFNLQQQTYAIPLSYTEAVVSLYKSDLHKLSNGLVSTYLGKTISVVFLKDLFSLKPEDNINAHKILQLSFDDLHPEDQLDVVIVSYNGRTIGLVVDKLLQQKEIVEKPLMKPLDRVKIISGVTILGNGNVCPVLNIAAISNLIFNASLKNHKVL